MKRAINETNRRRSIQEKYNLENDIQPKSIFKAVHDITERISDVISPEVDEKHIVNVNVENVDKLIFDLEKQMKRSSEDLEFEKAAIIRDKIIEIKKNDRKNIFLIFFNITYFLVLTLTKLTYHFLLH